MRRRFVFLLSFLLLSNYLGKQWHPFTGIEHPGIDQQFVHVAFEMLVIVGIALEVHPHCKGWSTINPAADIVRSKMANYRGKRWFLHQLAGFS